jgi:hypothetical protein
VISTERINSAENVLIKEISKNKVIEFAFIFDAYPKKEVRFDSDINLFVIGDINEDDICTIIKRVENKTGRGIDYSVSILNEFKKNLEKSFFHKEIVKNYQLIIGNEAKFKKIVG